MTDIVALSKARPLESFERLNLACRGGAGEAGQKVAVRSRKARGTLLEKDGVGYEADDPCRPSANASSTPSATI